MKSVGKEDEEEEEERAGSPQLEADLAFEIILEVAASGFNQFNGISNSFCVCDQKSQSIFILLCFSNTVNWIF